MNLAEQKYISIIQDVRNHLEMLSQMGCDRFDCSPETIDKVKLWGMTAKPATPETLDTIRTDLGECKRCGLCTGRKNIVFGSGNPNARVVFVGSGPGIDDDTSGNPFTGPSGDLLTKIIGAMKLNRADVYLCNVIKCRGGSNGELRPREIDTCLPFLKRQLGVIKPSFICTLGTLASRKLLDSEEPLSGLRGRFHDYNGAKLMPTFHPDMLLKDPSTKRDVWNDMQMIMAELSNSNAPCLCQT